MCIIAAVTTFLQDLRKQNAITELNWTKLKRSKDIEVQIYPVGCEPERRWEAIARRSRSYCAACREARRSWTRLRTAASLAARRWQWKETAAATGWRSSEHCSAEMSPDCAAMTNTWIDRCAVVLVYLRKQEIWANAHDMRDSERN